ncbi:FHA domain-containing protein [Labedella gwakjiensis]|uniref:FHA domain-containing protein n=1 Tax=Labedella gwakjiensis TaxID=390269 RepID=A0A2P8GXQ4_9MICO|nr:FHA domain-containing protein [Labedella gwakjiensis]PSL38734.1 FHA domain-containing protein [Labedella gwakjiensis]RUQ86778.1 FHA domain-containing protein [Labedella gwakjiensis]
MNPSIRYSAWTESPDWVLLVTRKIVLALNSAPDPALIHKLWAVASNDDATVDRVLRDVPADVGGVPLPFAVVGLPEDGETALTLFVHAGAGLDVLVSGVRRRIAAEGSPWFRTSLDGVTHLSLGDPAQIHAPALPLADGVVRAARLDMVFADERLTQPRTGSMSAVDVAHDGHTVLRSDLPRPRDLDEGIEPAPAHGPRSLLFGYRLNGSQPFALDVPHFFGRNPKRPPAGGRVVVVQSSTKSVSATHVEIEQLGDSVVVTDLKSTNGTSLIVPGASWQRLAAGQSLVVPAGTFIDIGDGNVIEIMPGQPLAAGH